MTPFRFVLPFLLAALAVVPASCAEESVSGVAEERTAVRNHLSDWWEIVQFETVETESESAPQAPLRKAPGDVSVPNAPQARKSGAVQGAIRVSHFVATLALTESIYEPLYSMGGKAIVQPLMESGDQLEVSGSVTFREGSDDAAPLVHFDQGGIEDLGRPLDTFDFPAVVAGSAEADAFLADQDAARAEDTRQKMMADSGNAL